MPTKKDLRNEVGTIVHAIANRALSDHTAKNIFGNVNYAKHFLQGTVVGFFDGFDVLGFDVAGFDVAGFDVVGVDVVGVSGSL